MRHPLFGLVLAVGFCAVATPVRAQTIDARLVGLGGLHLGRSSALTRYNVAYRAVPQRKEQAGGGGKFTIPIPLGLIKFFHDHPISNLDNDPLFDPKSPTFNPVATLDLILNPPLFYEVRKVPTPTNDVIFTIAKDSLIVDLGKAQALIPEDEFGLGGSGRPFGLGFGIHGVHIGVTGFVQDKVGFTLNDSLRAFLHDAHPAAHNTAYDVVGAGIVQGGFAPEIAFSERVWGNDDRGLYLGGAVRYYQGVAYTSAHGPAGFTTADTIFKGNNPVSPDLDLTIAYSKFGNSFGHGVGSDFGVVWVAGPFEIGAGITDIGAKLTWSDTRIEQWTWDTTASRRFWWTRTRKPTRACPSRTSPTWPTACRAGPRSAPTSSTADAAPCCTSVPSSARDRSWCVAASPGTSARKSSSGGEVACGSGRWASTWASGRTAVLSQTCVASPWPRR